VNICRISEKEDWTLRWGSRDNKKTWGCLRDALESSYKMGLVAGHDVGLDQFLILSQVCWTPQNTPGLPNFLKICVFAFLLEMLVEAIAFLNSDDGRRRRAVRFFNSYWNGSRVRKKMEENQ
jgi:hypothetical protein